MTSRNRIWKFVERYSLVVVSMSALIPVVLGQTPEAPGNPKNGRDLFVNKGCMRCHSIWERQNKVGPSLSSVGMGRNLYELGGSIWSHWSKMNAVMQQKGERITLEPTDLKDIIAYLYYLNYNAQPGEVSEGRNIFQQKGCVQCHAIEPQQDFEKLGKPVYHMGEFQAPVLLAVAIWKHGNNMIQEMNKRQIPWPIFLEKDVAHLVAFLRSSNAQQPAASMTVPGDAARGKLLFQSKSCTRCHTGKSATASGTEPDLRASGPASSLSSLIARLWNHFPRMSRSISASGIAYPQISRTEMEDLLAYVYWLKAFGLDGDRKAGQELYETRKCSSCHSPQGGKDAPAPALVDSAATKSVYSMLSAIWNHGPGMVVMLREKNLTWPELSGEDMRNLVAFFQRRN